MKRRTLLGSAIGLFIAPRSAFDFIDNKLVMHERARANALPPKLVTMYFPNGCDPEFWNVNVALSPLGELSGSAASKYLIFENVHNPVSVTAGMDAHDQGGVTLFTGSPIKSSRTGSGPSLDQIVSPAWNQNTLLGKPLVAGVWRGFAGGSFRSETWYRRSWLADGTPVTPIQNPLDLYRRVFGVSEEAVDNLWKKSALDEVVRRYDELQGASSRLGAAEKGIIADHMDKLRTLEKEAARFAADSGIQECKARHAEPQNIGPDSSGVLVYEDFERAYKLQMDIVIAALSCGATRSASLMFGSAGEEYLNSRIHSSLPDHGTSHYGNEEEKQVFLNYRRFHIRNVVYFANKLAELGLLNSTAVLVGTEFGESRQHVRNPQPHLLLGGTDFFRSGQSVDWRGRSQNDLYRNILAGLGVQVERIGAQEFNDTSAPPTSILKTG